MILDKLDIAISRIEKRWCKGALARDMLGFPTNPEGPRAVSWCIIGACGIDELLSDISETIRDKYPGETSIAKWNDDLDRTRKEVLEVLRLTKRRLENDQACS